MKCNLIVNAWDPEAGKQCGRLTEFVRSVGQIDQLNMIILGEKESEKSWGTLTELVPASSVSYIIMQYYRAEIAMEALMPLIENSDINLFPGNYFGSEMAVRLAVRMGGSSVTNAIGMDFANGRPMMSKKVYSGNIIGNFVLKRGPYFITVDKSCKASDIICPVRIPEKIINSTAKDPLMARSRSVSPASEKSGLGESNFVIAFGRGLGSKENARLAKSLAHDLGADFGCTRPVVMNAWAPMEDLVGVSGTMTEPEICMAAGVSGSPAFYAGIEKSRIIVAVNNDEKAPIMKKADVAVIGDWHEILEQLAVIRREAENDG